MSGSSGQRLADPFKRATYNSLSDHDDALGRGTDDESAAAAHSPAAELSQRRNGVSVIKAHDPQADQADRASGAALRSAARAGCSPRTVLPSMLPVLEWLPSYQVRTQLLGDIIAGLTVGMMVIPQGLGYASVATVPKVYGLYSAFMAPIVYAVVGGCKDVSVGPTAILSLLTAQAAHGDVGLTVQITMLCGLFQMALGMFNLGVLVDFISTPVLSGFTSAASVQIILTQIGSLCGYKLRTKVYFAFYDLFHDIGKIRVADLFLGLGCMVVLWFLGKLRNHRSVYVQQLATGRNAVLVCLGALLSLVVASASSDGVRDVPWRLVGQVPSGLPRVAVPDLSADTLSHSKGDVILIAFVGFLESIAIAKSFAKQNGYAHKLRNSQELFAVGSANVVGSFFGSLPVTGSFSRTAVASQAGAKTPLQGVVTGVVVLVALLILTPAFYYIPTALLAAIVIVASIHLIDYSICFELWKLSWVGRLDLLSLLVTFAACIGLDIDKGILVGISLSLLMMLVQLARPRNHVREGRELRKEMMALLPPTPTAAAAAAGADDVPSSFALAAAVAAPASSPSSSSTLAAPRRVPDWLMVWRVDSPLVFFNIGHICTTLGAVEVSRFEMVPQKVDADLAPAAAAAAAPKAPDQLPANAQPMLVNEAPSAAMRLSSPAAAPSEHRLDSVAVLPAAAAAASSTQPRQRRRRRRMQSVPNLAITNPEPGVMGLLPEPLAGPDALSPDDSLCGEDPEAGSEWEDADADADDGMQRSASASENGAGGGRDEAAGALLPSSPSMWDLARGLLDLPASDEYVYDEQDGYAEINGGEEDEEEDDGGEGMLPRSQSSVHRLAAVSKAPPRLRRCRLRALLLDMSCVTIIDTTAVRGLYQLCKDYAMRARPVTVHFACVHPHVALLLQRALVGAPAFPHGAADRLHPSVAAGVAAITALAHARTRRSPVHAHALQLQHTVISDAPDSPSRTKRQEE